MDRHPPRHCSGSHRRGPSQRRLTFRRLRGVALCQRLWVCLSPFSSLLGQNLRHRPLEISATSLSLLSSVLRWAPLKIILYHSWMASQAKDGRALLEHWLVWQDPIQALASGSLRMLLPHLLWTYIFNAGPCEEASNSSPWSFSTIPVYQTFFCALCLLKPCFAALAPKAPSFEPSGHHLESTSCCCYFVAQRENHP